MSACRQMVLQNQVFYCTVPTADESE